MHLNENHIWNVYTNEDDEEYYIYYYRTTTHIIKSCPVFAFANTYIDHLQTILECLLGRIYDKEPNINQTRPTQFTSIACTRLHLVVTTYLVKSSHKTIYREYYF